MNIITISKDGKKESHHILRKDLAQELGVHLRDLRPVFVMKQVATIMTREHAIILNFGEIKLVLTADKVFVSNIRQRDIKDFFIPNLKQTIEEKNDRSSLFEFLVLEFALNYKARKSLNKFQKIETSVQGLLDKIEEKFTEESLWDLLRLKKKISRFKINVEENESAALEVLEDEEELAELYLSIKQKETDEVESILESYLEQIEDIKHKLLGLEEDIDDTQEIITLKLNTRRNSIIRFDLIATMVTGILALLALFTGIFGMNISNKMENSHLTFILINLGLFVLFIILSFGFWLFLRKQKII